MFVSLIKYDLIKTIDVDAGPYQAINELVKQDNPVAWKLMPEIDAKACSRGRHKWQKVYRLIFSHTDLRSVRDEALSNRYVYERHAVRIPSVEKYILIEEIDPKVDHMISKIKAHITWWPDMLEENKEETKKYILKCYQELFSFTQIYARKRKQEVEILWEQVRNLS